MGLFARPWLLLIVPLGAGLIAWAEFAMRPRPGAPGPSGRAPRIVLRGLVALALALAAAGLRLPGGESRPACVFALDCSASLSSAGDPAAVEEAFLDAAGLLPPGTPRAAVAFAGEARTALGFRESEDELDLGAAAASLGRYHTDIASGLRAALGLLPPGAPGVIALVSDGRATRGEAAAAALECRSRNVPVLALPSSATDLPDFRAERLSAPTVAEEGRPVPLVALVSGTRSASVELVARRLPGGEEVGRARVAIVAGGVARARFLDRPGRAGVRRYEIRVTAPGLEADAFPENDRAEAAVVVRGRPSVLVLSEDAPGGEGAPRGGGSAAAELLRSAGGAGTEDESAGGDPPAGGEARFRVVVKAPEETPLSADALAGYAAVVLEGVGRKDLPAAAEAALVAYVSRGGGLLATGGPRAFGAGGWRDGMPLPDILPVQMAPGPLERTLLLFLVDASGSMAMEGTPGRTKIDHAREAVASMVRSASLGPDDEIALIMFREEAKVLLAPVPLRRRDEVLLRLGDIEADGKTSLVAPLEAGLALLAESSARKKVALLLSDGEPTVSADTTAPHEKLVALASAFKERGFALHVLGTNPSEHHRELLRSLAEAGGGLVGFETGFGRLAETLRSMVETAAGRYVLPGPVAVVAAGPPADLLEGLGRFPALGAVNRTRVKPFARDVLHALPGRTPRGVTRPGGGDEPVLAVMPVGAGRTAVFTSALGGPWAGDLAPWPARARFVSQLLRAIAPPPPDEGFSVAAARDEDDGRPVIDVRARDESGRPRNLLDLTVELRRPGDAKAAGTPGAEIVPAEQVALGRYRARVPTALLRSTDPPAGGEPGGPGVRTLVARVLVTTGTVSHEVMRTPVSLPPPEEILRTGVDRHSLEEIARASGGRLVSGPRELAEAVGSARARERRDVAPILAAVALALVLLELAARIVGGRFTFRRGPRGEGGSA